MADSQTPQVAFNFMGLPKETRLIIYEHVFSPIRTKTIQVFDPCEGPPTADGSHPPLHATAIPCAHCSLVGPTTGANMSTHTTCMPMIRVHPDYTHRLLYRCSGRLYPALLCVSREIHEEALGFLYAHMNLEINISQSRTPSIVSAVLTRFAGPLSREARAHVRDVRMTLDTRFCVARDVKDLCHTLNTIFPRIRRVRVNILICRPTAHTTAHRRKNPNPPFSITTIKPLLLLSRTHDMRFALQVLEEGNRCERLEDGGLAGVMVRDEVQTEILGYLFGREMGKQRGRRAKGAWREGLMGLYC